MTTSFLSRVSRRGPVTDYAIAVVSAATAIALVHWAFPASVAGPGLLFYLCAVMLVALVSTPGPAALSSVLTLLYLLSLIHSPIPIL